jgi:RNA polymerase sigma-70 factor (ECF subfamily)
MAKTAKRGKEGIRILFLEHHTSLLRFLRRLLHDENEVAEIAQEAYCRLLRHSEKDPLRDYERAYLFKTALNLIREHFRRQNSRARRDHLLLGGSHDPTGDFPTPERTLEWRQSVDLMREALLELPRAEREAFVRHRLKGHSYAQIAETTGISERTIRRRVVDALAHCRHRLRDFQ